MSDEKRAKLGTLKIVERSRSIFHAGLVTRETALEALQHSSCSSVNLFRGGANYQRRNMLSSDPTVLQQVLVPAAIVESPYADRLSALLEELRIAVAKTLDVSAKKISVKLILGDRSG